MEKLTCMHQLLFPIKMRLNFIVLYSQAFLGLSSSVYYSFAYLQFHHRRCCVHWCTKQGRCQRILLRRQLLLPVIGKSGCTECTKCTGFTGLCECTGCTECTSSTGCTGCTECTGCTKCTEWAKSGRLKYSEMFMHQVRVKATPAITVHIKWQKKKLPDERFLSLDWICKTFCILIVSVS